MAQTLKTIKLDVSAEQSFVYLKCRQYDENSRKYRVIFTDQNKPFPLNGDEIVIASMLKSNNKYADTICEWNNDELYFTMTNNMLNVSGDATMEIKIYDSKQVSVLGTMSFHVNIQKSTLPYDRMLDSDEFNALNSLILSVAGAEDTASELEEKLKEIKADINTYRDNYSQLSSEVQGLIDDLTILIDTIEAQENQRITNENVRAAAEISRINAEEKRASDTANAISNANTATDNANHAADAANISKTNADNAAQKANDSAEAANAAAENAEMAASAANMAKTNADNTIITLNELKTSLEDAEAVRIAAENNRVTEFHSILENTDNKIAEINTVLSNSTAAVTNADNALLTANQANATASATIQKLNEAIDSLDSLNPSVVSSVQPTEQEIGGLWFIETVRS